MREALQRGLAIREAFGIEGYATEDDILRIVQARGLMVRANRPYRGRVQGMVIDDTIYLRARMDRGQRVVVMAHELGHHDLHRASAFYVSPMGHVTAGDRYEDEAHLYAGALVLGRPPPTRDRVNEMMHDAFDCGVPASFLWEFVSILALRFPVVDGVPGWTVA